MSNDLQQFAYYASLMKGPVVIRHGGEPGNIVNRLLEAGARLGLIFDPAMPAHTYKILRENQDEAGIEFRGEPDGHEASSFILAVLQVSGIEPRLTESQIRRIKSINRYVNIETIYSAECIKCPDVVQSLNTIAVLNDKVSHVATNGFYFQNEVNEKGVMAVPAVFDDDKPLFSGSMTIDDILDKLGAVAREDGVISCDLAVVGGGPAGFTAAMYAARKGLDVCVLTDRIGGQLLDTNQIENITGVIKTTGALLSSDMKRQAEEYGVRIVLGQTTGVERVDGEFRIDHGRHVVAARSVVAATGAKWRRLNVEGEENLMNKGVTFCPHCDGPLFAQKKVVVVGGGNSGVEAALDLSGTSSSVTLIEVAHKLPADAVLLESVKTRDNINLITGAKVVRINGERRVESIDIEMVNTGDRITIPTEGVFIQAGLVPNTAWLGGCVDTNSRGEILTGKKGETSMPGLFAGGDATDGPYKQISTAVSGGAIAAMAAAEYINSLGRS